MRVCTAQPKAKSRVVGMGGIFMGFLFVLM